MPRSRGRGRRRSNRLQGEVLHPIRQILLIGVALARAVFPYFADHAARGELARLRAAVDQDTRATVRAGVAAVLVNLALSTALASCVNQFLLRRALASRLGALVYFAAAALLKAEEAGELLRSIRKRRST